MKHLVVKTYGVWRFSANIVDHSSKLRLVIRFRPRPLWPQGNHLRYAVSRRLGGPQNRSGRCRGERILVPAGNRTFTVHPVIRRSTD
jgi:hypothetical protein